jgi:hypothetical protein
MRQRRDKDPPFEADYGDIPLDAERFPTFVILPPDVRRIYEEHMALCEAAWREGEPLAAAEAATWARLYRQPISEWLERAVVELAMGRRTSRQAQRYVQAHIRLERHLAVRDHKYEIAWVDGAMELRPRPDVTWDEAYERAAKSLAGTNAAADDLTMKKDYAQVRRDLDAGRFNGKYFFLKDWRYRYNGKPDHHHPAPTPR